MELQKLLMQFKGNMTLDEAIALSKKIYQETINIAERARVMLDMELDLRELPYHLIIWTYPDDDDMGLYCRAELWDDSKECEHGDGVWWDDNYIPNKEATNYET